MIWAVNSSTFFTNYPIKIIIIASTPLTASSADGASILLIPSIHSIGILSMESNLIDNGEEEVFLQQLEMLKQQKVPFPPESERLYVKLLWRKVAISEVNEILENDRSRSLPVQSRPGDHFEYQANKEEGTNRQMILLSIHEQFFTECARVSRTEHMVSNRPGIVVNLVIVPSRLDLISKEVNLVVLLQKLQTVCFLKTLMEWSISQTYLRHNIKGSLSSDQIGKR